MIRAIETSYLGWSFRSRLEARWACFFNNLGIPFEYEPEGWTDGTTKYLPDFWLPSYRYWIEIKPERPNEEEVKKARMLVGGSEFPLFFLVNTPTKKKQKHTKKNNPTSYAGEHFGLWPEDEELLCGIG